MADDRESFLDAVGARFLQVDPETARKVYREARSLLEELAEGRCFGLAQKRDFM